MKSILRFACAFDQQAAEELSATTPEHVAQAMAENFFAQTDADHDGRVTREELLAWFSSARGA